VLRFIFPRFSGLAGAPESHKPREEAAFNQFPDLDITRIRLGPKAPEGLSLHKLGVSDFDPYYGGRFNAGSNKRGLEESLAAGGVPSRIVSAQEHFENILANLPA
jgi:hypothetical protein